MHVDLTRGVHRTHTPRGTFTGYSAATIDVTSLPMHRTGAIVYTVFVYGHIQGVGVIAYLVSRARLHIQGNETTAYRIYNILYCEAEEVGPSVTNN